MTVRETKRQYRLTEWAEIIRRRVQSGETVTTWCARNGIKTRVYYYWLKEVREYAMEVMAAAGGDFSILVPSAENETSVTLPEQSEELTIPSGWAICETAPEAGKDTGGVSSKVLPIEIGNCRVMADADVDPELLAKVCKILMSIC